MSTFNALEEHACHDTILILDFGSQYTHLITRRIREFNVFCELLPCTTDLTLLKYKPKGIILSGSPFSVYDHDAPHVHPSLWDMEIPILGICYGLQEIAWHFGGEVTSSPKREYGPSTLLFTHLSMQPETPGSPPSSVHPLLKGIQSNQSMVWMSHGDQLMTLPPGFETLASTSTAPFTMIAHTKLPIFGFQFHPEVTHTQQGSQFLKNFVITVCEAKATWTMKAFIEEEIQRIRRQVGETAHVVGAVSGGVDSTVAAKLMYLAIGDRFHGLFVDHGLLRFQEADEVLQRFQSVLKLPLQVVNASTLFYERLKGVHDPEHKRKIIGHTFIDVFEMETLKLKHHDLVQFLLQGTLYPDVIESISYKGGPSMTIKTHHNVGGLKEKMKLKLIEPLRDLFKDEVRQLGASLGIDAVSLYRHPFPGPGLGIRILGEVTPEKVNMVQQADHIYITELHAANLYKDIAQAYAALLPVKCVGVMGDQRTYEYMLCLRAVETTDFMTADWYPMPTPVLKKISNRIINEVKGINRVVYDVSSKPPATIELE